METATADPVTDTPPADAPVAAERSDLAQKAPLSQQDDVRVLFVYGCQNCPVELAIRGRYAGDSDQAVTGVAILDADVASIGHPDLRLLAGRSNCPVCGLPLFFKRAESFTLPPPPAKDDERPTEITEPVAIAPGEAVGEATTTPTSPPVEITGDAAANTRANMGIQAPAEAPARDESWYQQPSETLEVAATPAAVAAAQEVGVDLTQVEGTGKEGKVTKADVVAASSDQSEAPPESF